ncbi:MAG TPA: NAD-dependent epimerase/dehydratase family protein [Tepidisphaeraceae bacterium]|nr:NAD-dependent epimerase/dehydratase family protein [Tepidisphaeraceae bacterium]
MQKKDAPTTGSHPDSTSARIRDVAHLEELLSEPTPGVIDTVARTQGDFIVLGVGGKMGPTLARMLVRACAAAGARRRVIGVSRFGAGGLAAQLASHGVETISCDLLDPIALARLPDVPNVIFMAGMKFGSAGQQARTWAMNTYLPGMVAEKYCRSRIVAFSTGNVYPMMPVQNGGCTEAHEPGPVGEYAMSCLGRERIFEHFCRTLGIPMVLLRLNYAVEMRYGVLVDLAQRVAADQPVDLTMGNVNAIWQGDANAIAIQTLDRAASPPFVLNLTGPQTLSVRAVCEELGQLMGRQPRFIGSEAEGALLSNAGLYRRLFGEPRVGPAQLLKWTANWVMRGGESLGKPTHFETRDGKF